jgi:hypothetical protein
MGLIEMPILGTTESILSIGSTRPTPNVTGHWTTTHRTYKQKRIKGKNMKLEEIGEVKISFNEKEVNSHLELGFKIITPWTPLCLSRRAGGS